MTSNVDCDILLSPPKKTEVFSTFGNVCSPLIAHDYVSRLSAHERLIANIALFRRIYWDKFRVIVISK